MRSLRGRLALLYAGPFVMSGLVVLAVAVSTVQGSNTVPAGQGGPGADSTSGGPGVGGLLLAGAIGVGALVALGSALGWMVAGRFLRPLRTITATAREISARNLHRRLALGGREDE